MNDFSTTQNMLFMFSVLLDTSNHKCQPLLSAEVVVLEEAAKKAKPQKKTMRRKRPWTPTN